MSHDITRRAFPQLILFGFTHMCVEVQQHGEASFLRCCQLEQTQHSPKMSARVGPTQQGDKAASCPVVWHWVRPGSELSATAWLSEPCWGTSDSPASKSTCLGACICHVYLVLLQTTAPFYNYAPRTQGWCSAPSLCPWCVIVIL